MKGNERMKTSDRPHYNRIIIMPIVCLIVLVLALAAALPGLASGGEVTRGDFHTFADGIDRGY